MKNKLHFSVLFSIFFLAFILRFYNLSYIPPGLHGDEAEFGIRAQQVLQGNYENFFLLIEPNSLFNYSVLSYYAQGLFQLVFGQTVFGIRASSALIGTLTVILFYLLAKLLIKNTLISVLIMFAFATSHWHIAYSRLAINNSWTPFFFVAIMYFLYKGLSTQKPKFYLLSGLFLGLSLYFAQANRAFPLVVIGACIIHFLHNKSTIKKQSLNLLLIIATSVIVFLPLLIYYFQNPDIFVSRIDTVSIFNNLSHYYQRYNTDSTAVVLLWQLFNTLKVFMTGGDIGYYFYAYPGGLLAPIASLLAFCGFVLSIIRIRKPLYSSLIVWFLTIITLGGVVTVDAPSSQRLLTVIPILFLFVGIAGQHLLSYKIRYIKTIVIFLFLLNGAWDYKIYFINYIHSQAGWAQREPATQIAYYLRGLGPDWKVYMLREDSLYYFRHGTIKFINPTLEGEDIESPETVIPNRQSTDKNLVYIMPHKSPSLSRLRKFYPEGKERNFFNPIGNTPSFTSYEIRTNVLK